ncbi:MAG: RNA methyltransferase, partial [Ruminococcus sp.]|nr:RNA methyltransferase [Ruminococcus sp.]
MIIASRKNQTVVKSRGLINEKKLRDRENLIAAEGIKLCEEAIRAGLVPEYAVFSEDAEKKYAEIKKSLSEKCQVFAVTNDIYAYLSAQKSPQGIFIAAKLLDKSKNLDRILEKDKILILDGIQDSGNLGTIIRTAEAFGIGGVILSPDCADPYSPKTLRASMGSAFRLPLVTMPLEAAAAMLKEKGFDLYAAMLDESARRIGE